MSTTKGTPGITLAAIARQLGTSAATVSMALRNNPEISAAMTRRVRAAAKRLGYTPDPQLSKLMQHLRQGRRPGFRSTVTGLTTIQPGMNRPYALELMNSAARRAAELGYGFNREVIPADAVGRRTLERELVSRGIEGLLFFPMAKPLDLTGLLDWRRFSVVAATYAVLAPEFHRVVPHQFGNMLRCCRELQRLGYRRIGLVMDRTLDVTVHHGFTGAVMWQNGYAGTEPVEPLLFEGTLPPDFADWHARERPDAMIVAGEELCREIAGRIGVTIPGPVGFAVTNSHNSPAFAGIDEDPRTIGAMAMDMLHAKLQVGERGIPRVPSVTMVNGDWRLKDTVCRQASRARAARASRAGR